MSLESDLFERLIPDEKKLIQYGFRKEQKQYIYGQNFFNDDFKAIVIVNGQSVAGHVYDCLSGDEYTLFRRGKIGSYASQVRSSYLKILEDIGRKCFTPSLFAFPQSRRIAKRIETAYGIKPVNKKKAIVFTSREGRIFAQIRYLSTDRGKKEILDVRTAHKYQYFHRKGIYDCDLPRHSQWISMTMDGSVRENFIYGYLEESYRLIGGRASYHNGVKEWIMPVMADFNIEGYFRQAEVSWRQRANYSMGDIIYIYVGKPYSCILYKYIVKMTNISEQSHQRRMILVPLKKYQRTQYPLSLLKKFGVPYVRGPRYMPEALSALIEEEN